MGAGAERQRHLALPHPEVDRREPAPPADRRHRPVPGALVRPAHADRGDDARARRSRALGEGALRRLLELPGVAPRRSARRERPARHRALRLPAAALQPALSRHRDGAAAARAAARASASSSTTRWPAASSPASTARATSRSKASRFTLGNAGAPLPAALLAGRAVRRGRRAAAASPKTRGVALASVAVAWAIAQPGITSAIVGASRPEQLDASLAAVDLELDDGLRAACDARWWSLPRRPVIEGYR